MTTSSLVHQVEVSIPSTNVLIPERRSVWNQFDEHGLIGSLKRLAGENNSSFRRRILDTFINQANSSYRGLINGITRELGLSLFQPIQINPKRNSIGFIPPDPYILFNGANLYLYSDFQNNILDYKIDRFEQGGNYEHISRLVDFINTTENWEASVEPGFDSYIKSMSIINQSNRELVSIEDVQQSTQFRTKERYIVPGSLLSNNQRFFGKEVSVVSAETEYSIDYDKGIISLYSAPDLGVAIRYHHVSYPWKPIASSVILHDINSEDFKIKMFEQVSGNNGTPNELGVDIINELLSIVPMYWGV